MFGLLKGHLGPIPGHRAAHPATVHGPGPAPCRLHGIAAGTRLATEAGWRPAEEILVGDRVLTFDSGPQRVTAVTRDRVIAINDCPDNACLIRVPVGVLGNREVMILLPEQHVMVESDTAEALTGDPFALVPAKALLGFRGVQRLNDVAPVSVVTLQFEADEMVYVNGGALMLAPAAVPAICGIGAMETGVKPTRYTLFNGAHARALVAAMALQDARAIMDADRDRAAA